jgi:hypothetical protein
VNTPVFNSKFPLEVVILAVQTFHCAVVIVHSVGDKNGRCLTKGGVVMILKYNYVV